MVCYPKRVFKNEDIDIAINVPEDEVNEFSLYILTDKETKVEVPLSAVTDGVVHFEPGDLDLLNDGIIRYELSYSVGDNDYAENTNTNLILKTPSTYSAKTAEDWYNEGYEAGLNDCSGETPDCSEAYQSGYTEGVSEQKAKLTGLTANTNMIYERTDGYDRVVVNVPTGYSQSDLDNAHTEGYNEGLAACSGDCDGVYESGYTEGFEDGYASGQTDCSGYTQEDLDAAFNRGYNSGYTDGQSDCSGSTDYTGQYLTFNIKSNGVIVFKSTSNQWVRTVQYSMDRGNTWNSLTSATASTANSHINVQSGDVIWFKGTNDRYGDDSDGVNWVRFDTTASFDLYGNIMSLIAGDNFESALTLTKSYAFFELFAGSHVLSAENLVLPATAITEHCYDQMFNQTTITKAPKILPATTLQPYCYHRMFINSWYLVGAAPILPAAIVPNYAYYDMFAGCGNISSITCLATDISATECVTGWVSNVAAAGTFTKAASMNDWTTGINGIPSNWTVLDAS